MELAYSYLTCQGFPFLGRRQGSESGRGMQFDGGQRRGNTRVGGDGRDIPLFVRYSSYLCILSVP